MIDYLNLQAITARHITEIEQAMDEVVKNGWYLRGEATRRFEQHYAQYIGSRHCIGCGNGLDALTLILRAYIAMGRLREGDEVLVPANTYIASILSITENGLKPILVEPDLHTLQIDDSLIESAITPKTRALMIVHLYGRCAYTETIGRLCQKYQLLLIEDNAQAHGCRYGDRRTGALGDAAAHSFYPGKNLGALGDAGAVTTDDDELAEKVRALGNYGSQTKYLFEYKGKNSRMDEIQAAILDVKLKYLDAENKRRKQIAEYYLSHIHHPLVTLSTAADRDSVWHIFPILCEQRDRLQQHLAQTGIETLVHYPIPPHRQPCYTEWQHLSLPVTETIHRTELSLPCHPCLSAEACTQVAEAVNSYCPSNGKRP